jgi:hypothetical protein
LIQAPLTAAFSRTAVPQQAFLTFIPFLVLSAIGAWLLPSTAERQTIPDEPLAAAPAG